MFIIFINRRSWHGPPPFFLPSCLQIYFQQNFFISLLFHLFFLILTCSCQYSYNLMLTTICMFLTYIDTNNPQGMQLRRFKNRTPARFEYIYCTLFPLSFKLGHVSIPKRPIFSPLFLFCAYDSSVLHRYSYIVKYLIKFVAIINRR